MRSLRFHIAATLLALLLGSGMADADTRVEVLDTYPSGNDVTLGPNENFYLRIAYDTDEPVRIWARAYYQGREAKVGSNPSRVYSGEGEALGWFFFLGDERRVDEVRISVGAESSRDSQVLLSVPVRVTGGASLAAATGEPEWVTRLKAEDERIAKEDYERRMSEPVSVGDMLFFQGFMLAVLALGIAGIAAPVWAIRRWDGGWRLAACAPAAIVAFVIVRIIVGTSIDPTSHNLWPFEVLMASLVSVAIMAVLFVGRKVFK